MVVASDMKEKEKENENAFTFASFRSFSNFFFQIQILADRTHVTLGLLKSLSVYTLRHSIALRVDPPPGVCTQEDEVHYALYDTNQSFFAPYVETPTRREVLLRA
jgi:hypothetical protein